MATSPASLTDAGKGYMESCYRQIAFKRHDKQASYYSATSGSKVKKRDNPTKQTHFYGEKRRAYIFFSYFCIL